MKNSGPHYRFVNRSMTIDPDETEGFNQKKFDSYQPVSIMGIETSSSNKLIDSIRANCIFITALSVIAVVILPLFTAEIISLPTVPLPGFPMTLLIIRTPYW